MNDTKYQIGEVVTLKAPVGKITGITQHEEQGPHGERVVQTVYDVDCGQRTGGLMTNVMENNIVPLRSDEDAAAAAQDIRNRALEVVGALPAAVVEDPTNVVHGDFGAVDPGYDANGAQPAE